MRVRNDTDATTTTANSTDTLNADITQPLMNHVATRAPLAQFDNVKLAINDERVKDVDENTSLNSSSSHGENGGGGVRDAEEGGKPGEGERGSWGGKLEFLFTCIGYAVGLGNVWRFPYLCYKNGGGAFLVPYVLMLAVVGLPLFFMELAFGQFASLGPITVWKVNRTLKGLGYAMVATSWLIAVYYNVVISHVMMYLFASFAAIPTGLPWVSCDNWWNTDDCIAPTYATEAGNSTSVNGTANGTVFYDIMGNVVNKTAHLHHALNGTGRPKTPAEEYYSNFILEQNGGMEEGGSINWKLALCLLLAWIIILICLIRGIQSLGKVVYFTAIFPYIMLTILLIRSATLPGAIDGMIFYLKPDFSRLSDPRVWSDAATQIFYSLSACSGGLIAMASYNKFDNNCYKDALIVAIINCATSIYSGFVIFCVLGFMALEKGVAVADVAQGGPGLAFVVYPEALSRMPAPQLWAIFFFFMMATLGFGSQLSIVECVLSAFTDEFAQTLRSKWASVIFRTGMIFFLFLMGLPMCTSSGIYLLNLVDYSVSGFPLLVIGFLEVVALNWVYGYDRFSGDIEMMLGFRLNIYWKVCWMGVTPVVIILTIIFNIAMYKPPSLDDYYYPDWAQSLGWCIGMFPIFLICSFFLWTYCRKGGFKVWMDLKEPKTEWGPALPKDRTGRYEQSTHEMATQSDYTTMWTQTRIVLARTPMPSSFNLSTSTTAIGTDANDLMRAVTESHALSEVELLDAACGTPDEELTMATSMPIAIPPRVQSLRDQSTSPEKVPTTSSPPRSNFLEVRMSGTSPGKDESSV